MFTQILKDTALVNFSMKKRGSPHYIQFFSDPDDPHFIIIELRKQKGGAIVTTHYVLKSDLNQWQSMYEKDGYKQQEAEQ